MRRRALVAVVVIAAFGVIVYPCSTPRYELEGALYQASQEPKLELFLKALGRHPDFVASMVARAKKAPAASTATMCFWPSSLGTLRSGRRELGAQGRGHGALKRDSRSTVQIWIEYSTYHRSRPSC